MTAALVACELLAAGLAAGEGSRALGAPPSSGNVAVIDNRTPADMRFSIGRPGGKKQEHLLRPGQVLPLEISGHTEITFTFEGILRHHDVLPKSIYSFWAWPGGVDLEKTNFPVQNQPLRVPLATRPPQGQPADRKPPDYRPATIIPVKILVDEEQLAAREKWEKDLRRRLKSASDVIERHCGLRFEVQSFGTWQSDNNAVGPYPLDQDFEAKVDPRPAWLAIGFTSQQRTQRGKFEKHRPRLFPTHIVMRDWTPGGDEAERVEQLVHALGHYLGAADSSDPLSAMRPLVGDSHVRAQKFPLQFDALNTLLLNLVAQQIRTAGPAEWPDLPPRLQRQLSAIWTAADFQPRQPGLPRRVDTAQNKPLPPANRFSAAFVGSDEVLRGSVHDWGRKSEKPLLDQRALFDGHHPVRWLRNDGVRPAAAPAAYVELIGGDRVPGRVVAYRGRENPSQRDAEAGGGSAGGPAHLVVEPAAGVIMHRAKQHPEIRVLVPWVRRVVWQRVGEDRYEPSTVRLRTGGTRAFRSLQFNEQGVKLLLEDGVEQVPFAQLAEVHLPAGDFWAGYYRQLAVLSPDSSARLVRWDTATGLRATGSTDRFAAFDGADDKPDDWIHMLQPAWSLDPLFVRHRTIRLRSYFAPSEMPLSLLEPVASQRKAIFSGAWNWHADHNCRGGTLRSGRQEFAWGLGVHATSQLEFELPALATSVRTRVGLDRLIGRGGCARAFVFVDSQQAPPVFHSKLLLGSREVQDSGPIALRPKDATAGAPTGHRLILLADMAAGERPSGADPLDVRDAVDWLEPLVGLDRNRLQDEVDRCLPSLIDAWAGWNLAEGTLQLVNWWDKSIPRRPAFRLDVQPRGERIVLARKWHVASITDRLKIGVSRPRESSASQIEIHINGGRVGRFTVPVGGAEVDVKSISLRKYVGQDLDIRIVQVAHGNHAQVHWHQLAVME